MQVDLLNGIVAQQTDTNTHSRTFSLSFTHSLSLSLSVSLRRMGLSLIARRNPRWSYGPVAKRPGLLGVDRAASRPPPCPSGDPALPQFVQARAARSESVLCFVHGGAGSVHTYPRSAYLKHLRLIGAQ